MKIELMVLQRGDLQLEVIAETDAEYHLLCHAWELQGYPRGNGRSIEPKHGGSTGFYIPLCALCKDWTPKRSL